MNPHLLNSLAQANLLNNPDAESQNVEKDSPWYIKIMLAFSGWLAAIFILGFFFAVFSRLYQNTPVLIIAGTGLITAAYFLFKSKKVNEFLEHLGLAFSLAGQGLLFIAIMNLLNIYIDSLDDYSFWFVSGFITLTLAVLMPNFLHRIFSTVLGVLCIGFVIFNLTENTNLIALYGIFMMMLTAVIWLNEFRFPKQIETLRAFGYGLVLATLAIKATTHYFYRNSWNIQKVTTLDENIVFQPWMEQVLLSIVTLYVVWKLLQKVRPQPSQMANILALVGVFVISVLSFQAQGLLTGTMIILLGFSASNRVLLGLGVITLLYFISNYYYSLQNTLLDKSITLFMLGIALLLGRFIMLKLLPEQSIVKETKKAIEGVKP